MTQIKATRQRKRSSLEEEVASSSTTAEASADDAQPIAAELDKAAPLEATPTSVDESSSSPQLGLVACPECGQRSLFWNRHDRVYRCVNPECKRKLTLEEYKDQEAQRLLEKTQVEQEPASVSATEVVDKQQPAMAEKTPSSESTTVATGGAQPPAIGEVPVKAADRMEPVAVEQTTSRVSTAGVKDEGRPVAIEVMPSNVSAAEVKEETERGEIEKSRSDRPATEAGDEAEEEAKAGKQMNRNLAFLLIGVLAIGIVLLGVFMWQKSSDLDDLSSQLSNAKAVLTASQAQLAASQREVEGLKTQLAQSQQELAVLQAAMNELMPLTPGEPFVYSGELSAGEPISIPIELTKFDRVEGAITGGLAGLTVYIQDPGGGIAVDLGRVFRSSFTFTAPTSGTYAMIITGSAELGSSYIVNFAIYSR